MVRSMRLVYLVIFVLTLSGCSTLDKLKFWQSADDAVSSDESGQASSDVVTSEAVDGSGKSVASSGSKHRVKNMTLEEMELKQAKIWARVDSLEDQVNRQRERMRVLEKGLLLGLIPEELKDDARIKRDQQPAAKKPAPELPADAKPAASKSAPVVVAVAKPGEESGDSFETRMAAAQDYFRAGRYGRAIAEYSTIGKEFKQQDQNGSHQFWIALSWLNLKEFNAAQQNFASFLRDYPNSPWAVRSHFYLARVEAQLGMREKSLQRLRRIISDFPNEDVAEMAKMEIGSMGKTL